MSGASPIVTPFDRLLRGLRAIIREENSRLTFFGTYEFAVQSSDGATADCSPTDTTISLPATVRIPLRFPLATAKPSNGQKVLLTFINGDPTRPVIFASDPAPTTYAVDATGTITLGASSGTVNVGGTASSIKLGPIPLALAYAAGVTTALGAINTAFGAIFTYAGAIKSIADPSGAATTALGSAMSTVSGAIGTAVVAIPTTVVKGT